MSRPRGTPNRNVGSNLSPHGALALAILCRAGADCRLSSRPRLRHEARVWLRGPMAASLCESLGVDYTFICEALARLPR